MDNVHSTPTVTKVNINEPPAAPSRNSANNQSGRTQQTPVGSAPQIPDDLDSGATSTLQPRSLFREAAAQQNQGN